MLYVYMYYYFIFAITLCRRYAYSFRLLKLFHTYFVGVVILIICRHTKFNMRCSNDPLVIAVKSKAR
jgi:hypothetical protein